MSTKLFIILFILFSLLEYFLHLLLTGWPIVLVPELILFFFIKRKMDSLNLFLVFITIGLYELLVGNLLGVTMLALLITLLVLSLLNSISNLQSSLWFTGLLTGVASVVYLVFNRFMGGWLLARELGELSSQAFRPSTNWLWLLLEITLATCFLVLSQNVFQKKI